LVRTERGLTLKEVAAKTDVSFAHLARIERGENSPPLSRFPTCCVGETVEDRATASHRCGVTMVQCVDEQGDPAKESLPASGRCGPPCFSSSAKAVFRASFSSAQSCPFLVSIAAIPAAVGYSPVEYICCTAACVSANVDILSRMLFSFRYARALSLIS
jgi:hypothetical protein